VWATAGKAKTELVLSQGHFASAAKPKIKILKKKRNIKEFFIF
jgi:hypothetical protein